MAVAEYDYADFEHSQQNEQDQKLLVKFYTKAIQDRNASEEQGRPVYKDAEYIDIRVPGSRDGAARRATARDIARFPRHYAAFKQRIELPEEGTPLTEWGGVSRSLAEELAFANVKTVEQLCDMPDNLASQMRGIVGIKAKAQAWVARCREDVTKEKLEQELASRDKLLDEMQEQMTAMKNRLSELEG